jgi:regulator of ribosome biosynthesis
MTKWEKFRIEKGLPQKEKRSRMVFDPLSNDWVPRYGTGSIKKMEDKYNVVMEEKEKHREAGMDPFTYKKNEKKIEKEK